MAGRIYPLFMLQDPRRNLYAPIYKAKIFPKEKALSSLFFHMALDVALHIALCGVLAFIIKLFAAAKTNGNLDV